ncbi:MAG: ABC transporter ATP-binding protein [Thermodesulfobacteriota bacterium]
MVIVALIEVTGIASIMPFLVLIATPEEINKNQYLRWFYELFNFTSTNRSLLFVGLFVFLLITISNAISALVTWMQFRFSWNFNHSLSKRLLSKYLHQPYLFFLNRNTADLIKSVLSDAYSVVRNVLIPGLQMIANSVVALFILIFLIVIDPLLAIGVILVFGFTYALIYTLVRRKLARTGKKSIKVNTERFKIANEAFRSIKYIKLLGKEEEFLEYYLPYSSRYTSYMATNEVIGSIPGYAIDSIAFGGILVIVLYLLTVKQDLSYTLPLIGVYAFAVRRLIPALKVMLKGLTSLRFNLALIDLLYKELNSNDDKNVSILINRDKIERLPFREKLELKNITFYYPGTRESIIRNLNLCIKAHTSVAFVGETGAGKTTIVDIILGLLRPNEGSLLIDDVEITDEILPMWQKNLGYVPQEIYLQDDTLARNIAFGVSKDHVDMDAVVQASKIASLHDFVMNELPDRYETVIGEQGVRLSGGQRQRIGIARAVYHNPAVLVMDEATSALDGVTESVVLDAIKNLSKLKTLILITHRVDTARDCDVLYLVDHGHITAEGTFDELINSNLQFRNMAKVKHRAY